jgi:hypothetical protein
MAFQLSPGVNVSEIDLTTVVPAVATSDGAFAGVFRWGPVGERVLVDSENALVSRFAKPTNFNPETFFTAANFLSYANRLYISRAADTVGATPVVSANVTGGNNILVIGNTIPLSVGMYIAQCSNASITFGNSTVNTATLSGVTIVSKNSSTITLSSNTTAVQGSVSFYFARPETAYTAVAFDTASANAFVANLVNQIVKNENDYTLKDGTFDSDVVYVSRYPGALGNSLRVSICDTSASYNSNIDIANSTVNTAIQFVVGSNTATVKFVGSSNASANTVKALISTTDQILAGNSSIGLQYMQVTGLAVASNTTANVSFNGNADVSSTLNFITVSSNPFVNGDIVVYANAAGNSVISGLNSGTSYHIVQANSTGFKVSATPLGDEISLTSTADSNSSFTANVNVLSVSFEDPYRLHTAYVSNAIARYWEFFNVVDVAPGQSNYQLYNGNTSAQDELHVVVVDNDGGFSGTPGTVLEVYRGLSRASDAKNDDGTVNYYKDVINQNSNYVWWTNDRSTAVSNTAANLISATSSAPMSTHLVLGADGLTESTATLGILGTAYDLFAAAEDIDISLVLQGKPMGGTTVVGGRTVQNFQLANYIIDNITDVRRDCIALISPDKNTVLNNVGDEALDLRAWRGAVHSSSYAVLDSGYKYQYDKYNDIYRWIPLNGDIAGLCVRTDNTNDAWWSPAGFNRGQIKNLVKIAFNPRKSERDVLYSNGINPVVTFPGQGTVLYGDKTLQAKPSAFDRINVRRLFIVLEKAISTSAKYSLFEFNDAFTRAQFRNLVTPYLRTIQGRRGITDFLVVCDDTNNTPQIIDTNQFVGDIYIKPARSINFIQLNFVAVPTGVQFSEVVGKF